MRWHLAEFGTEEEKLLKENTIGKIDAFLEKFTADTDKLANWFG